MPHKGTRSTVSVAGVGLMLPRSGVDSGEDACDAKRETRFSASGLHSKSASWRELKRTIVARRVSADAERTAWSRQSAPSIIFSLHATVVHTLFVTN